MTPSNINTRPTSAENETVAVKDGNHSSAPAHVNLLELEWQSGKNLLKGVANSVAQPIVGARAVVSGESSTNLPASTTAQESESLSYKAGTMIGQAIDFGIVQTLAHKLPLGKNFGKTGAAMTSGFVLGFLSGPSSEANDQHKFSLKARLEAGLEGAATIGIIEGGAAGLSKLGIKDSLAGKLIKSTVSGAAAGAISTQVDSKISTGHFASWQDTAIAAASWGLTGAAFTATPSLASGIKNKFEIARTSSRENFAPPVLHEPVIDIHPAVEPPRAVINLDEETHQGPKSYLQIRPRQIQAGQEITPVEFVDLRTDETKPVDDKLRSQIAENHSQLDEALKSHLQLAAEAIAESSAPNKPLAAADLIGKDFDSKAFASIYERLHASSANYEVIGVSKEQWLAEPALRIAKTLGSDWSNWLEASDHFKEKSLTFNAASGERTLNLAGIAATARQIPLASDSNPKLSALLKAFLLDSPDENSKHLSALSALYKREPEAASFLLEKDAATTRGALTALRAVPDLPTPLAVDYANEPYTRQLAASLAWKKLSPQLSSEEARHFLANDFSSNPLDIQKRFQAQLENVESSDPRRLLQDTPLTANVVAELHPGLNMIDAATIAGVANKLSPAPFELVAEGFKPQLFLEAYERLEQNRSRIVTMTSLWDRDTKAFELVNTFGDDYKTFVDQIENKLASSHYSRDQFYSDLHLPLKSPGEMKPLADFLLRNSDMPISETHSLFERLNASSNESFKNILASSDQEIRNATRSWMLAPDLPFGIAAHFGDKKTTELTAAALAYFEQMETASSVNDIAHLDTLKADAEQFASFWQKYPDKLALGKHALVTEANCVRAAIGAYHPNLSERHRFALESAAMSTNNPLQYVAANTKAGVFGRVFDRMVASGSTEDGDWHARSALASTNIFGRDALHWLDKQEKRGLNLHDATRWLPMYSPNEASGLGDFLNSHSPRKTRELRIVATRWPEISDEVRRLPFRKIISKLRENAYQNVESPAFAKEAFDWDVSAKDYARDEPRFLNSLDTPSPFPLNEKWVEDNLTGRFLPRSDPRGLYLGEHTNCCQHPGEAGASCAWFGQESARSGFFVVENTAHEIVAQSWAWISDKGALVFDSIEAKGLEKRADAVSKIYQKAANDLSQEFPLVTLGKGTNRVKLEQWPEAEADTQLLPAAYENKYTDAKRQVVLAKNVDAQLSAKITGAPEAIPQSFLNSTLIRTNGRQPMAVRVSDSVTDLEAAELIAAKVYPADYGYVSDGDRLLVLDAAGHGTVGYASIDLGSHEVSDLAVLEKFRPHSRLLMKGIYDFLRMHQEQPGQIWNAELRASTSDRLVNYYEQKGLLTLISRRQVDTMHGEPMYSVRFTLP